MKRNLLKIIIAMVTSMAILPLQAQSDNFVQEINAIKRSGNYFYEEAKAKSESQARQDACVKLATSIMQFMSNNGYGRDNIDPNNLPGVQYKSSTLGSYYRVFAYVPRNEFVSSENIPANDEYVDGEEEQFDGFEFVEDIQSPTPPTTPSPHKETSEVEVAKATLSSTIQTKPGSSPAKTINYDDPELIEKAKEHKPSQNDGDALSRRQQSALSEIINSGNLNAALEALAKLQSRGIVARYGVWQDCPDVDGSYWIVGDKNANIIALLSPGSTNRHNYCPNTSNNLSDYSGQDNTAIWFRLVKN